jgi:hypothetical protein
MPSGKAANLNREVCALAYLRDVFKLQEHIYYCFWGDLIHLREDLSDFIVLWYSPIIIVKVGGLPNDMFLV